MKIVVVETPFAGDRRRNLRYLGAAMRDCLMRGEIPIASHALYAYTGALNDDDPSERDLGIRAGLELALVTETTVVYVDLGCSKGMALGLAAARREGRAVEERSLPGDWSADKLDPKISGARMLAMAHLRCLACRGDGTRAGSSASSTVVTECRVCSGTGTNPLACAIIELADRLEQSATAPIATGEGDSNNQERARRLIRCYPDIERAENAKHLQGMIAKALSAAQAGWTGADELAEARLVIRRQNETIADLQRRLGDVEPQP